MGAGERGELHDVEPDAADAEHHDRLADLHLGVVVDHARRGRHGAAEQRRDLASNSGAITRHAVLRDDRMPVEGRDPAGIERLAAPLVARRPALDALARPPMQHHACRPAAHVSRPARSRRTIADASCPSRCGRNLSGPFAASISLICAPQIVVCSTLHQHLAGLERVGQQDLVDDQRRARLRQDRRLGGLDCIAWSFEDR